MYGSVSVPVPTNERLMQLESVISNLVSEPSGEATYSPAAVHVSAFDGEPDTIGEPVSTYGLGTVPAPLRPISRHEVGMTSNDVIGAYKPSGPQERALSNAGSTDTIPLTT